MDLPGYDLHWYNINTTAQRYLDRGATTYALHLNGRILFPEGAVVLAASPPKINETFGDDPKAAIDRSPTYYNRPGFDGSLLVSHGSSERSVSINLNSTSRLPSRIDRLTGHFRLLVSKEIVRKDVDLTQMQGFVELTPELSVSLDRDRRFTPSSQTQPSLTTPDPVARDVQFTLRYRKPAGGSETHVAQQEANRPPIVVDFTLLDDKGQELESRGPTRRGGLNPVNMGRVEASLEGSFRVLGGQAIKTLRLIYIPTVEEKTLNFVLENVDVP